MSAIINQIDPITFELQTYTPQDLTSIPSEKVDSGWGGINSYAECTIISADGNFQITDQNFNSSLGSTFVSSDGVAYNVDINPEKVLIDKGFTNGEYNIIFKFLNNELSSSSDTRPYLIKEISADRTELRIVSNFIGNDDLINLITEFRSRPNSGYFQDFYLNFGSNNLIIANNLLIDNSKEKYDLLINLYEPLPQRFKLREPLWIVTQPADPLAFNVKFQPKIVKPKIFTPTLKSANFNIPIKDKTNNSTIYLTYNNLITTSSITPYQQLLSYLEEKSIDIGIDYTKFKNFVHFSSAKNRIENFDYKLKLITQYKNEIKNLEISSTNTDIVKSNVGIIQDKINSIIKNFDGYEYFLYFTSGSEFTYPKSATTTTPPYTLLPTSNAAAQLWLISSLESASIYDANNKDYLYYTIPEYLRDDPQNDPYKVFIDMMGQYYDNIWIYYKDVTNRYSGDNRLEFGISKDLVADAIKSFGLNIYQNNASSDDLFNAFVGYNPNNTARRVTTSTLPPGADKEVITTYEFVSQESLNIPLNDVSKEIYKRIYHNLPYLLKSKGTVAGLQNIISMFGITSSILTIKEFGGAYSFSDSPEPFDSTFVTGIKDIISDNIEIYPSLEIDENNKTYSTMVPIVTPDGNNTYKPLVLPMVKSAFQEPWYNNPDKKSLSPSVNTIEVAFSPQNDVDNYIKNNTSATDIGNSVARPFSDLNGYAPYYSTLINTANGLLSNNEYNLAAYLHLIKYFDNSLFLMIKDFVPAKTNLKSGIVIKQHLLNRSKHDTPRAYINSSSYVGLIPTPAQAIGGTGGAFDEFNTLTHLSNSQFWFEQIPTPLGYTSSYHKDQAEFYNGELPNYPLIVTNGEVNTLNLLKNNPTYLNFQVVNFSNPSASFINGGDPGSNTIALWFDATEGTFNTPNIYLPPNYGPGLGGVVNSPNNTPTSTVPDSLPITTDKGGSSGGGTGGSSIGGGGRNTTPEAPETFR
jgi:hypothetical protein